jgi:cytochrome o ubiquinol oxidase subunit II
MSSRVMTLHKKLRPLLLLPAALLAGCNTVVMNASGDVAVQQGKLIAVSTWLMLLIIVPVMFLIVFFAWKYRQSNTEATYAPDWDHSTALELVIWSAPLLIIIALGAVTWISTHTLDPYRPLQRIDEQRTVAYRGKTLPVEVVALDWKWLFIYPEQGIAVVNEMAAPVDMPIDFKISASSVMNSFFVPALAGQIYAMPSMETKLHAVINKAGVYDGFSANYSGAGFSHMRFKFHGLDQAGFDAWIAKAKAEGKVLTRAEYMKLEQPSEKDPVQRYSGVDAGLFSAIVNRCVDSSKMCMNKMMAIDSKGLGSTAGYRVAAAETKPYVEAPLCTVDNPLGLPRQSATAAQ